MEENNAPTVLTDLINSQLNLGITDEHNDFVKYLGENKSEDAEEKTLKEHYEQLNEVTPLSVPDRPRTAYTRKLIQLR